MIFRKDRPDVGAGDLVPDAARRAQRVPTPRPDAALDDLSWRPARAMPVVPFESMDPDVTAPDSVT